MDRKQTELGRRLFLTSTVGAGAVVLWAGSAGAEDLQGRGHRDLAVVRASDFGYDPVDGTSSLQAALDAAADVVIFDNVGEWVTRPLFANRDNFTLLVEPGVTVRAKTGGFPNLGDCLLRVMGRSGVTISGYGATFVMNKPEYTTGQWRMGIQLGSSSDVTIEGLTIKNTGGDGIYVGTSPEHPELPRCQNIRLRDVTCDGNKRNGLSIISVDGLLATGCAFINSVGANPQVGVDFEPNGADQRLANIELRDCVAYGNANFNVAVQPLHLDSTSWPMSILINRMYFGTHGSISPNVNVYGPRTGSDPGGSIEFRDTFARTVSSSGCLGMFNRRSYATELTLTRTVWWNIGNAFETYSPFTLYTNPTFAIPEIGAVTWSECVLVTDQAGPFLKALNLPAGTHVANLQGDITVINENGATVDLGSNPQDIDLDITPLLTAVDAVASVGSADPEVEAGSVAQLQFARTSSDVSRPLAIEYAIAGTAVEREHYSGLTRFALIPANELSVQVPIHTRDAGDQSPRTIVISIVPGEGYTPGPESTETITVSPGLGRRRGHGRRQRGHGRRQRGDDASLETSRQ